jgi:hypothetical protein
MSMAKFSDYRVEATRDDGKDIVRVQVTALGLEQAYHKAVTAVFEMKESGDIVDHITVSRITPASEFQG